MGSVVFNHLKWKWSKYFEQNYTYRHRISYKIRGYIRTCINPYSETPYLFFEYRKQAPISELYHNINYIIWDIQREILYNFNKYILYRICYYNIKYFHDFVPKSYVINSYVIISILWLRKITGTIPLILTVLKMGF